MMETPTGSQVQQGSNEAWRKKRRKVSERESLENRLIVKLGRYGRLVPELPLQMRIK